MKRINFRLIIVNIFIKRSNLHKHINVTLKIFKLMNFDIEKL